MQINEYMTTKQVAAYLGLSPRTLERYRWTGQGPAFYRFGNRVRYLFVEVARWAVEHRMRSTSDDLPQNPAADDEDGGDADGDEEDS